MKYVEPQQHKNVIRNEEDGTLSLNEESHKVFLPFAKRQIPAVRIVATQLDRFGRYQMGYAVFAVISGGKRETLILPARQETGKETGNVIWSAQAKLMGFDSENIEDIVDAMAEAVEVVNPVFI